MILEIENIILIIKSRKILKKNHFQFILNFFNKRLHLKKKEKSKLTFLKYYLSKVIIT